MWIAFYRGRGDSVTRLIRWFGRSPYSHVGIVFRDGKRFDASGRVGLCRWVQHDWSEGWEEYPLDVTIEQYAAAYASLDRLNGLPFDYLSVLRFVFPLLRQGHGWYCTQLVAMVMREHLGIPAPEIATPARIMHALHEHYKRQGRKRFARGRQLQELSK
jgi:hypothetical protein